MAVVALLTLRQRDDGHVQLTHSVCDHYKETQFPLANLVDDELDRASLVLASPAERASLTLAGARSRFFAESKLARVLRGEGRVVDVTTAPAAPRLRGSTRGAGGDAGRPAQRTLGFADRAGLRQTASPASRPSTAARLMDQAIVRGAGRLIAWCQVEAALTAEPGLFFEVMLAVSAWLDEHWDGAPGARVPPHARAR